MQLLAVQQSNRAHKTQARPRVPRQAFLERVSPGGPTLPPVVQAKLRVNAPNDKYEQEADRVADRIMRMPEPKAAGSAEISGAPTLIQRVCRECEAELRSRPPAIQRMCAECEEELHRQPMEEEKEETIQAKEVSGRTPEVTPDVQAEINCLQGSGQPLPESVRAFFEPRFGYDFSRVMVHTGARAASLARAVNACAFTVGNDIVFGQGEFSPRSSSGQRLVAHELTHVAQQTASQNLETEGMTQTIQRAPAIGDETLCEGVEFPPAAVWFSDPVLARIRADEALMAFGWAGEPVALVQQALAAWGCDEGLGHLLPQFGVDGIFGSETHGAVQRYQGERSLRVDGIVGPETMGDLDRSFSGTPPRQKVPPEPVDICSILFSEQETSEDRNGLVFVKTLTPDQRTSAHERPKADLPDGGIAIDCTAPSKKEGCKDLCGCPLPSSGYQAKVEDLAQVMENATAFHEEDPQPGKDPRQLVCPPADAAVRVLRIIPSSNGITWLRVRFCNGPIPDKKGKMVSEVFIQQRFVTNGKQFSINGPNEIVKPNSIKLTADGAHPGTNPVWEIIHDENSHGRATFVGSHKKATVEIEGEKLSSLQDDVTVKAAVCGHVGSHQLTIRQKFAPNLPVPPVPKTPPGPVKPPGSPPGYCEPIADKAEAMKTWLATKLALQAFISTAHSNNKDARDLYMTYMETPKIGTKGTLPARRLFSDDRTAFVKSFINDPETDKERKRILNLIKDRVKKEPKLIPPVGKTTLLLPFRTVLKDPEIMDLPMNFTSPTKRIPGFVAGGAGKNASDAGDDVRNVDGQFRVTNQGGGTLRIQIKYIFDVHDAVDFCPGAPGGPAAWALTVPLSRLEATPDVPTYDTPFEVLYTLRDDVII